MARVKNFDATGEAPNGRLYAGDLNAIQDAFASLVDYAQNIGAATFALGDSSLKFLKYAAGDVRLTGALRTDGIVRALGGIVVGVFTTTQRNAIPTGFAPFPVIIFNSTTNRFEWNAGSDASRSWQSLGMTPDQFNLIGTNAAMVALGAANHSGWRFFVTDVNGGTEYQSDGASWIQITTGLTSSAAPTGAAHGDLEGSNFPAPVVAAKKITAAKLVDALRPSQGALDGDEALRAIGTGAGQVAAGNDTRLSFYQPHTFIVTGEIRVAVGELDVIPPMWMPVRAGRTVTLVRVRSKIHAGTSVTFKVQKNGADLTGFTGIAATTVVGQVAPTPQAIVDNDELSIVVTAVSGIPKNLSVQLVFEVT